MNMNFCQDTNSNNWGKTGSEIIQTTSNGSKQPL